MPHCIEHLHAVLKPAEAQLVGVLTEGEGCACGTLIRNTWGGHRHKIARSTVQGLSK